MLPHEYIEKGWCQKATARTKSGDESLSPFNDAVKWCVIGSLAVTALPLLKVTAIRQALLELLSLGNSVELVAWNDTPGRTQVEVVQALRQAERAVGLLKEGE